MRYFTGQSPDGYPTPSSAVELVLAEKFHWSLEYIRSLPKKDIEILFITMKARDNAQTKKQWLNHVNHKFKNPGKAWNRAAAEDHLRTTDPQTYEQFRDANHY